MLYNTGSDCVCFNLSTVSEKLNGIESIAILGFNWMVPGKYSRNCIVCYKWRGSVTVIIGTNACRPFEL